MRTNIEASGSFRSISKIAAKPLRCSPRHRHHENKRESAEQTCQENGAAKRRIENDLAPAGFFGWIRFLIHRYLLRT